MNIPKETSESNARLNARLLHLENSDGESVFQLRVQHFGAEKLDNELNIKWERTFLLTCSKTGDVFLRQRLSCARKYYGAGCGQWRLYKDRHPSGNPCRSLNYCLPGLRYIIKENEKGNKQLRRSDAWRGRIHVYKSEGTPGG